MAHMPKVIILGASNAIPTAEAENSHFAVVGGQRMVLVDTASNPVIRLDQAGLDFNNLTDVILTHFHPDHVSGLPLLLMDMWLMGRRDPINIYGLHHTIDRVEQLMGLYGWSEWPDFFPVVFYRLPASELTPVLDCRDFKISASPVHHMIPTIGLRIEFGMSGKVLAYSCDTEPCDEVVRLSEGADVLIHEAAGGSVGHSSASQAGRIASRAEVGELLLIHYATGKFSSGDLVKAAGESFQGRISLAKDFMTLDFSATNPLPDGGKKVPDDPDRNRFPGRPTEP
jgi:ribonuclease Z